MRIRRGTVLGPLLALGVIVIMVLASAGGGQRGDPYAPDSTAPRGAKAMVELLTQFGAEVNIRRGIPSSSDGVALVLEAELDPADADTLRRFAREGATVVVATPDSSLAPAQAGLVDPAALVGAGRCSWALPGVERLGGVTATFAVAADEAGEQEPQGQGCFGEDQGGFSVVRVPAGDGEIIAVGGPDVFTNRYLAQGDNAVLATNLLVGRGPVAFVRPGRPGGGEQGLLALLPGGFWRVIIELTLALVVLVWASAPRLGRPVAEPMLLALPGTALAEAAANLYQRAASGPAAARWLRRRAHQELAARVGLAPNVSSAELSLAVAAAGAAELGPEVDPGSAQAGERAAAIEAVLEGAAVPNGAALLVLADNLDRLRREVSHGPS